MTMAYTHGDPAKPGILEIRDLLGHAIQQHTPLLADNEPETLVDRIIHAAGVIDYQALTTQRPLLDWFQTALKTQLEKELTEFYNTIASTPTPNRTWREWYRTVSRASQNLGLPLVDAGSFGANIYAIIPYPIRTTNGTKVQEDLNITVGETGYPTNLRRDPNREAR